MAKSIDFGGTVNQIGYDNMKFGVDAPNGPPGTPPATPPNTGETPPIIPPINGGPPITLPGGNGGVINPIPEPSTYALMAVGLALLALAARRRRQRA